jgi:hypothetical protein
MKTTRIAAHFSILIALCLITGCITSIKPPAPDPLVGWTFRVFDDFAVPSDQHHYHLDKAITHDYQVYIANNKLDLIGAIRGFYEDGTGQSAVEFEAERGHSYWRFVLIYNKDNKRIKTVKFDHRLSGMM